MEYTVNFRLGDLPSPLIGIFVKTLYLLESSADSICK